MSSAGISKCTTLRMIILLIWWAFRTTFPTVSAAVNRYHAGHARRAGSWILPLLGNLGHRRLELHSTAEKVAHRRSGRGQVLIANSSAGHNKGDLAAHLGGRGPFRKLGKGSPTNLLMHLGQLTAESSPPIGTEPFRHGGECRDRTVRRLEED